MKPIMVIPRRAGLITKLSATGLLLSLVISPSAIIAARAGWAQFLPEPEMAFRSIAPILLPVILMTISVVLEFAMKRLMLIALALSAATQVGDMLGQFALDGGRMEPIGPILLGRTVIELVGVLLCWAVLAIYTLALVSIRRAVCECHPQTGTLCWFCAYDLRGISLPVCPECGNPHSLANRPLLARLLPGNRRLDWCLGLFAASAAAISAAIGLAKNLLN